MTQKNSLVIWKEACLVLLVLFPMVMLQLKFLLPLLSHLNLALATFICNALSVLLIAWPLMPLANYFLKWWLFPRPDKALQTTILGTMLLAALYCLEIVMLWPLFA